MKQLISACCALALCASASAADLAATLESSGQFKRLMEAAKAAGLAPLLNQPGPYTIFAPTDAAFEAVPPERIAALMKPENKEQLAKLLSYHMVVGRVDSKDWQGRKVAVKSAVGMPLAIEGDGAKAMVNGVKASRLDVGADNGIVHVIDQVLMPPTPIVPKTRAAS